MKPAIDMTRRKSPITVDAVLRNQRRALARTGTHHARVRLRADQAGEFYALLQNQWAGTTDIAGGRVIWNSLEIVVRKTRA